MKIQKITVREGKEGRKSRIYFFVKETILENLENRRCRPHTEYLKLVPDVLKSVPILRIPNDIKVKWSQKAGCHCGCSPGFILDNYFGKDIYVDIS